LRDDTQVTGAKWQFKDWPFKGAADGDLVDTFAHVKGFHLKYSDTPLQPQIKDWPVSIINIPRISRHNDACVCPALCDWPFATREGRKSTRESNATGENTRIERNCVCVCVCVCVCAFLT
jgi:hypothetical protein